MQNRGLVKFFAILFALVSIYQLSFTFIANSVESKAKAFANGDSEKEVAYLDSIGKQDVFLGLFTYDDVKGKKINKGLDLEGGINVILQISVKDILKQLANNSNDPVFNKALDDASKNLEGNQTYIDAFFIAFDDASQGKTKLASPDIFANRNLQGEDGIGVNMTDKEAEKVIRRKVDESVNSAFLVLRKRIDKFGVTQPNIQKLGETGRILVELPGAKDIDRISNLLSSTAQLEFWETYSQQEIGSFLAQADAILTQTEVATKETKTVVKDTLASLLTDDTDSTATASTSPFLGKSINQGGGPVLGVFYAKDTAKISEYLKRQDITSLLQGEQRFAKFVWGKPTTTTDDKGEEIETFDLYALKGTKNNIAPMSGGVITEARDEFDAMGRPSVSMQMNGAGAKAWEELTGKAYTERGNIAIVLDDVVYSAPGVTTGAIAGGNSQITGDFTVAETKDLANVLKAGKLPAKADIIQREVVGPSLGQEAIDSGINSALLGLLLVSVWMVFYYGRAGIYANVALAVNLLFLFGVMASFGFVLTLPGIAGIVLTMGTAVDANIIIYERAKEELRAGKTLEQAIKASFSWTGAMRSIVDANVTHILTGIVLFVFGTGPIQGFAITLLIGILTSLFTSIFIARIFMDRDVYKNRILTFSTSITKNWFTNFNFNFLGVKKYTYIFSSIVVIVSIVSLMTNGLNEGVDFVGGRTFQVRFAETVHTDEVKEDLNAIFGGGVEAKVFGKDNQLKITTKYKIEETSAEVDTEVNNMMYNGLKKHFGPDMTYERFVNTYDGKTTGIMQASKVGPTVAEDIKTDSYWAVLGAMAIVFLYLTISFRKWQYSLGAIAAVAHDVIFVLGIYSLMWKWAPFGMEIDQHFIAAILTVIGYSMNDTVIVFDRVREYLGGKTKGSFNDIVNKSVNSTMARTLNTSLTMIMVLLVMFIFGGESIRGFIFAMLIGMIVGTYSSLFIATPVLCDTIPDSEHKRIETLHNSETEA